MATNGTTLVGEMRDRAVGLAVAHRRTVGPARPVHQDEMAVSQHQPLVAAGRGIARHPVPLRLAQAAVRQEAAHRRHPLHPRREAAVTGHPRVAELELELGGERERDVEPVGRQPAAGAVGPFEQHHRALGQVVEAELGELGGARGAVEVGMHHLKSRQIVGLHQREGRARDLDGLVVRPDSGSGRARTWSCRRRDRPTA